MEENLRVGDLPDTVLEHILSFLTFDNIAKLRRVNKRFDMFCKSMLNKGFRSVEKYHAKCIKEVKAKLPRRESERRDHPLARHNDILTAIETRISLLSMTFMKYVDLGLCCFIPGKVIDEIYTVLKTIKKADTPSRSCEVLQELRDISSMAMEYFDEKIVPDLKNKFPGYSPVRLTNGSYLSTIFTSGSGFSLSMRYSDPVSPPGTPSFARLGSSPILQHPNSEPSARVKSSYVRDLTTASHTPPAGVATRKCGVKTARLLRNLKRQADAYKSAVESQNKKMLDLDRRIDQQNEIINQQNARLAEQEEKLAEMSRRLSENENKFTASSEARKEEGGDETEEEEEVLNSSEVGSTPARKRPRSVENQEEENLELKRQKICSSVTSDSSPAASK